MIKLEDLLDVKRFMYLPYSEELMYELETQCHQAIRRLREENRIIVHEQIHSIMLDRDLSINILGILPAGFPDIQFGEYAWEVLQGITHIGTIQYLSQKPYRFHNSTLSIGYDVDIRLTKETQDNMWTDFLQGKYDSPKGEYDE